MTARRLTDEVWLIGSGSDPDALTSAYDCHAYLVDGGDAAAVVDCGSGLAAEELLANLAQTGCAGRVSQVLVTHYHADHAGGAARLHAATGARVRTSVEAAPALRTADEERTQVDAARRAGVYPPDYRCQPCAVDSVVADGTRLRVGDLAVSVLATPGHCDGHLCFLVEGSRRTLFTGDAVFHGGLVSIQPIPDCRPYEYGRSVERLAALDVDDLLAGHGEFVLGDGTRHLTAAASYFRRLVPPPNFLT